MSVNALTPLWRAHSVLQAMSMALVAALALGLTLSFVLSTAGILPGLTATLTLSDGTALAAGPALHGAAALVALLLVAYMPANWRMRALETSHRSFRMGQDDVIRAYRAAHAADRAGAFKLGSEYDAVRERMEHLANHPDLGHLEPGILELAAQMSQTSQDLARKYSDETVARARAFLTERQTEAERMQERIETALAASRDIRRWHDRVALDEDVAQSRLNVLIAELDEVLPEIGLAPTAPATRPDVIRLSDRAKPRDIAAE
ncbi:DNA repair protein [Alphaproteobacteria bacterium GH1-50]|uniref:DNA repair protein n=1 Tax=Kangsaoukella pontilimi TaxID=2691042 RepID=A0A7C9IFP7_9RHOB|nr:DNA repair protein [Kangsaoukella pontilimi]MXQ07724.1 DNA repair protein [Kangsaoukella pontilimi]